MGIKNRVDPALHAFIAQAQMEGRILSDRTVNTAALSEGLTTRVPLPGEITVKNEGEFQSEVRKAFVSNGWDFYHTHNSRRSDPGMLDCIVARMINDVDAEGFVAELKIPPRKPTDAQRMWLKLLAGLGISVFVWYPFDWKAIVAIATAPVGSSGCLPMHLVPKRRGH